jgi:hypothetical protein
MGMKGRLKRRTVEDWLDPFGDRVDGVHPRDGGIHIMRVGIERRQRVVVRT